MTPNLRLGPYTWFCSWVFPRSYSMKFLAVAFLGIHLPLIAYAIYLAFKHGWRDSLPDLLVVLAATLVGTGVTLWIQYVLLAPVRLTAGALQAYRGERSIWPLPEDAPDEAGELMRNTRDCLQNLDRLLRLKDQLAAGIAHDFRSPMAAISLAAELSLSDRNMEASSRRMIERVQRTAEAQQRHLSGLLAAVLDDTRNARFDLRPVPVAELWQNVRETLQTLAEHRGLELVFEPSEAVIAADAARITQVLNNLTSNALRVTPPGGSVRLSAEPAAGGQIVFHVRDTGPGLAGDVLQKQLAEEADGPLALGLGLRLARSLVHLHASRLLVDSQPGQGADFHFALKAA